VSTIPEGLPAVFTGAGDCLGLSLGIQTEMVSVMPEEVSSEKTSCTPEPSICSNSFLEPFTRDED
jgi:hypothetical protein